MGKCLSKEHNKLDIKIPAKPKQKYQKEYQNTIFYTSLENSNVEGQYTENGRIICSPLKDDETSISGSNEEKHEVFSFATETYQQAVETPQKSIRETKFNEYTQLDDEYYRDVGEITITPELDSSGTFGNTDLNYYTDSYKQANVTNAENDKFAKVEERKIKLVHTFEDIGSNIYNDQNDVQPFAIPKYKAANSTQESWLTSGVYPKSPHIYPKCDHEEIAIIPELDSSISYKPTLSNAENDKLASTKERKRKLGLTSNDSGSTYYTGQNTVQAIADPKYKAVLTNYAKVSLLTSEVYSKTPQINTDSEGITLIQELDSSGSYKPALSREKNAKNYTTAEEKKDDKITPYSNLVCTIDSTNLSANKDENSEGWYKPKTSLIHPIAFTKTQIVDGYRICDMYKEFDTFTDYALFGFDQDNLYPRGTMLQNQEGESCASRLPLYKIPKTILPNLVPSTLESTCKGYSDYGYGLHGFNIPIDSGDSSIMRKATQIDDNSTADYLRLLGETSKEISHSKNQEYAYGEYDVLPSSTSHQYILTNIWTAEPPLSIKHWLGNVFSPNRKLCKISVGTNGGYFKLNKLALSIGIPKDSLNQQCDLLFVKSTNMEDISQFIDQNNLVSDVYHFLPHGKRFRHRIMIHFPLKTKETKNLCLLYSDTDHNSLPVWKTLTNQKSSNPADSDDPVWFVNDGQCFLFLNHFCLYCVATDESGVLEDAILVTLHALYVAQTRILQLSVTYQHDLGKPQIPENGSTMVSSWENDTHILCTDYRNLNIHRNLGKLLSEMNLGKIIHQESVLITRQVHCKASLEPSWKVNSQSGQHQDILQLKKHIVTPWTKFQIQMPCSQDTRSKVKCSVGLFQSNNPCMHPFLILESSSESLDQLCQRKFEKVASSTHHNKKKDNARTQGYQANRPKYPKIIQRNPKNRKNFSSSSSDDNDSSNSSSDNSGPDDYQLPQPGHIPHNNNNYRLIHGANTISESGHQPQGTHYRLTSEVNQYEWSSVPEQLYAQTPLTAQYSDSLLQIPNYNTQRNVEPVSFDTIIPHIPQAYSNIEPQLPNEVRNRLIQLLNKTDHQTWKKLCECVGFSHAMECLNNLNESSPSSYLLMLWYSKMEDGNDHWCDLIDKLENVGISDAADLLREWRCSVEERQSVNGHTSNTDSNSETDVYSVKLVS